MEQKLQKAEELKKNLASQQALFTKAKLQNEAAVKASFVVAEEIATLSRPLSEGEFLKSCMMKVCNVMCPDKVQKFGNVNMSRNTIANCVCEIFHNLRAQLMERSRDIIAYSLFVDERTDVKETAQLAIFIRGVDSNLCVADEILDLKYTEKT